MLDASLPKGLEEGKGGRINAGRMISTLSQGSAQSDTPLCRLSSIVGSHVCYCPRLLVVQDGKGIWEEMGNETDV